MKKSLFIGCSLLVAFSVGCTANQTACEKTAPEKEAKMMAKKAVPSCTKEVALIQHADEARKKAGSVGGEWRDTAKFIKQAHAAVKKGDCHKAEVLANKAIMEGNLGYDQAMSQKTIKMPKYFNFK